MNGTMPATVNNNDGSGETSEALGTTVCPRCAKCSRNRRRISAVCMYLLGSGGRVRAGRLASVGGGRVVRLSARGGAVPAGQPHLLARRERGVEPGAGPQLRLALGGGGADVGTELTDGVGEVPQAVGDRPADAAGGELLRGGTELADDEHADGDAHRQPEQAAHQAARRAARRARRSSRSRRAASAIAWPSRFFFVALRTP